MHNEEFEPDNEGAQYEALENIDRMGISASLRKLHLLGDDMYLRSQAQNLNIVDNFITELEYKILLEFRETERMPELTFFLSAQSQMWIFAAYELLRTWQQRAKEIVKWSENGGLEQKLKALVAKNDDYVHHGRENRIRQIESVIKDADLVPQIQKQLLHLHIPFARLEYIRISIAKHEVKGEKSAALMPGYARINSWCGSLDYELENGRNILGYISRRDVADSIRHLDCSQAPPTDDTLKSFDDYMCGKGLQELPAF